MNTSLSTPARAGTMRRFRAWAWNDPDMRSTTVGVGAVLVYLLFMLLAGPYLFRLDPAPVSASRPSAAARQFRIQLADAPKVEVPEAPPKVDPFKFVEVNPDAPENTPDKTNNFGAKNQQVAQEKPTPDGKSDRPATEGKKDLESTSIVSGQLTQQVEHMEAIPETPTPPAEVRPPMLARQEQNPFAGFEKKTGESADGFGSNLADLLRNAQAIPDKIEGQPDAPIDGREVIVQPAIDPAKPRPRQTLAAQPRVRPAYLSENLIGTSNIGPVAYDARWSNYGEYLQRLIETVQIEWERVLYSSQIRPPSGSRVTVKFILDSKGAIARIVNVDNQSSELGARACVSGIRNRSPFGPWTEDMIAMLGEEQELTFSFYYQ